MSNFIQIIDTKSIDDILEAKDVPPKTCPHCGQKHSKATAQYYWEDKETFEGKYTDYCQSCFLDDLRSRPLTKKELKYYGDKIDYHNNLDLELLPRYTHPDFGYGFNSDEKEKQIVEYINKKKAKKERDEEKATQSKYKKQAEKLISKNPETVDLVAALLRLIDEKIDSREPKRRGIFNI